MKTKTLTTYKLPTGLGVGNVVVDEGGTVMEIRAIVRQGKRHTIALQGVGHRQDMAAFAQNVAKERV